MKALVIYDSIFGNTEKIARAIGDALVEFGEVDVQKVNSVDAAQLRSVELVIVGSPTRGFRPTPEMAAFLKNLPADGMRGIRVAAFDTRVSVEDVHSTVLSTFVNVFGYAADPIAKQLKKKGGIPCGAPTGFFVKDREGPLADGELERAGEWARTLEKICRA